MCGINGLISSNSDSEKQLYNSIDLMNNSIVHRGPDDDGVFVHNGKEYAITMGMRRLSIIDLSTGKQPIYSADKEIVIVFNGEIYNYRELRKELEESGIHFTTKSDTEVILKLYEKYGSASFARLDGMFAFSILDKRKNKVFIARDFFGEKPLYYTQKDGRFIWASELKSILNLTTTLPAIDNMGLNLYFRLTYIPAPYTIYQGIYKLEPNKFITYNLDSHTFEINSTEISEQNLQENISFNESKETVKKLVRESVESRSVSDVPIGTFLSGGVDSSIVSLCLAQSNSSKINTFSIGFEKKSYDESDKAREVAKLINSNHHEFILGENELENDIDKILLNFDEPFADSSALPTYIVAHKTAKYVKVALTGDGGDEVFGGYNKYHMGNINQKYTKFIPQNVHSLLKRASAKVLKTKHDERGKKFVIEKTLNAIDYSGQYYWDIISLGFSSDTLANYLLPHKLKNEPFKYYKKITGIDSPKNLTEYRKIDKHISLEGDMLVKVDRTSMLTSLECRAPFLNKKLWNYTNSLPSDHLIKGWDKKHILKEAFKNEFSKGFLNSPKSGFGVPVGDWLRSALRNELESFTDKTLLKNQNIFDVNNIKKLVDEHLNGIDHTFMVWTFYCFQKWYLNK